MGKHIIHVDEITDETHQEVCDAVLGIQQMLGSRAGFIFSTLPHDPKDNQLAMFGGCNGIEFFAGISGLIGKVISNLPPEDARQWVKYWEATAEFITNKLNKAIKNE